jgi:hypothetical protein
MNANNVVPIRERSVPWWLWTVLAIALVLIFLRANKSDDDVRFWAYVTGCAHEGDWAGIYDKENNPFAFAPYGHLSMTLLLYPLGYLSQPVMRVFLIVTIFGMWYAMFKIMQDGTREKLLGFRGWLPLASAAPILGMILAGRYLLNDLNLKQLNMITFTSGCLGLWLMMPQRKWSAQICGGGLLAFSIGLKLFTLPLLVMLALKGGWRQAAAVSVATIGVLWLLPRAVLSSAVYDELSAISNSATMNMWLQVKDTSQTWSFLNFVHYRIFLDPVWPGLDAMSPRAYQAICVVATILIGLPTLRVLLRCRWRDMDATQLWEELAMVGVAWALIDPDGRTAHYVSLVPAFSLIIYRRLEAWHERREAPRLWQWATILVIGFTTLWLVRLPEPLAHHWYMQYGLFSIGLFSLYGLTYYEIRRAERCAVRIRASSALSERCSAARRWPTAA